MEAENENMQELFNKDLEELKNQQIKMNSTEIAMKSTLEQINSRISEAEEWVSELEDRMVEITAIKQNCKRRMKINEDSLRDLWDNIKHINILITDIPEVERQGKDLQLEFLCTGAAGLGSNSGSATNCVVSSLALTFFKLCDLRSFT